MQTWPAVGRRGGGGGGANPLPAIETQLSLRLFSWMRGDTYAPKVSNLVPSFVDRVALGFGARAIDPNHAFTQGVVGQRVQTVLEPLLNNQEIARFVRTSNTCYNSTLAPLDWAAWHDGTGGYCWFIGFCTTGSVVVNDVVAATRFDTGSGFLAYRSVNASATVQVIQAANSTVLSLVSPINTTLPNNAAVWRFSYALSDTPDGSLFKNAVLQASGNQVIAPSPGAPQITMRIGSADPSGGGNAFGGAIADVMFAKAGAGIPDTTQLILQYALLRYGFPAP